MPATAKGSTWCCRPCRSSTRTTPCGSAGGQARGENRSREARSQAGGEACCETGGQARGENRSRVNGDPFGDGDPAYNPLETVWRLEFRFHHSIVQQFSEGYSRPRPWQGRALPTELFPQWRPLGDSNPCYRRERAVSWRTG